MGKKEIEIDVNRPHDTFFKKLMGDVKNVRDFIEGFFPEELVCYIDMDSLEIINTEKSDEKYKRYYLDMGVRCKIEGIDSELYFVFEHKSYPDRRVLIQILSYFSVMWKRDFERGKDLRPIIPVIFYHGKRPYNLPQSFADYFNVPVDIKKYMVDFEVVLFDTTRYGDDIIINKSKNLYLCASLLSMKHVFDEFKKIRSLLISVLRQVSEEELILVIEYLVASKDIREEEVKNIFEELGGKKMSSLAKRWIEQGIQQGVQQGIQQGIQQGMVREAREMVLEALEIRFNIVPESLKKKIGNIHNRDKLKALLKVIMRATDIKEVEKEIGFEL
ncbi:Rpn family recombination-promoting nuclease/putative transposase [Desulfothermus okinawensis JCM 13304]